MGFLDSIIPASWRNLSSSSLVLRSLAARGLVALPKREPLSNAQIIESFVLPAAIFLTMKPRWQTETPRELPVERTGEKQQHSDQAGDVASTEMSAKKNELAPPVVPATTHEVASPPKAGESEFERSVPADPNVSAVAQQPLATLAQSTGLEQMPGTSAGRSENRERVKAFIARMRDGGLEITRKKIWIVAGYADRTEFQRFQAGHRCTPTAREKFNRVLGMTPEVFASALKKELSSK